MTFLVPLLGAVITPCDALWPPVARDVPEVREI